MFYALGGGIFNNGIHRETDVHNCHEVEMEVEWMLNTFYFNQTKNKQPNVLLKKNVAQRCRNITEIWTRNHISQI